MLAKSSKSRKNCKKLRKFVEKEHMRWYLKRGEVIDYLEEYIEQIIVGEFEEKEYEQVKFDFMQSRKG